MNLKIETYRGIKVGDAVEVSYPAQFVGRRGTVTAVNVEFAGMCNLRYEDGTTGRHMDMNLRKQGGTAWWLPAAELLPGGDAGMFPAAHPRPTLAEQQSAFIRRMVATGETWCDLTPARSAEAARLGFIIRLPKRETGTAQQLWRCL